MGKRIKLMVAYDGTSYSGWQIQNNGKTIEGELDKAIKALTGEDVHVIGASRTDAGVHAFANVAVFDTESRIPGRKFSYALNSRLPEDIAVQESWEVSDDFHPRHCNTQKTYEYKILQSKMPVPQLKNYTWHVDRPLDIEKMRVAAGYLVGKHDFVSFCCVKTDALTTVRTIYSIDIVEEESCLVPDCGKLLTIRVRGNGFLYNMVRIIAGTLMEVGSGKSSPEDVLHMLESLDRTKAGRTAPPQGLTLKRIEYVDGDDAEKNI